MLLLPTAAAAAALQLLRMHASCQCDDDVGARRIFAVRIVTVIVGIIYSNTQLDDIRRNCSNLWRGRCQI